MFEKLLANKAVKKSISKDSNIAMVADKLNEAQHTCACCSINRLYSMSPFSVNSILGGVNWNPSYIKQTCPVIITLWIQTQEITAIV